MLPGHTADLNLTDIVHQNLWSVLALLRFLCCFLFFVVEGKWIILEPSLSGLKKKRKTPFNKATCITTVLICSRAKDLACFRITWWLHVSFVHLFIFIQILLYPTPFHFVYFTSFHLGKFLQGCKGKNRFSVSLLLKWNFFHYY